MNKLALLLISLYQNTYIFPRCCKYYPSCSNYAREAFEHYKFGKALFLSVKRILRCNALSRGGYDPLP